MTSYLNRIRQKIGHQKIILTFTSACILNDQGQVLMQRRSDFGWWGLPGGMLEPAESLSECVRREVLEETGFHVELVKLIGMYSSPDFDIEYPNGDQAQQVTFCFLCQITGGRMEKDDDETLELGWFDPAATPPTARWYEAMLTDLINNQPEAAFQHGSPGSDRMDVRYIPNLRQHLGQDPLILPGAVGLIQNEGGEILLVRRSDSGLWALPGGGMELGERLDTTAVKEIFEETGLWVEPFQLAGVYTGSKPLTFPNGDQIYAVYVLFRCNMLGGILAADGIETLEARFFPAGVLPPLTYSHKRLIEDGLAGSPTAVF